MGQPKHLLKRGKGLCWVEHLVSVFRPLVSEVVISGRGDLPVSLSTLTRTQDLDGAVGPLAGIAGAMKCFPQSDWLTAGCDMINISSRAISWLIEEAGYHGEMAGVIPVNGKTGKFEPLLGYYRPAAYEEMMKMVEEGNFRIGMLGNNKRFHTPVISQDLESSWENVNTPVQLQEFLQRKDISQGKDF